MKNVKFLIMDVDGTLTDGKIYMGANGELMKAFNIKDGAGIHDILIPHGIMPVIITGRESDIVRFRCKELGIEHVFQGVSEKAAKMLEFLQDHKSSLDNAAYIGDDINDLACMKMVKQAGGLAGCPSDAINSIKEISDFISTKFGGNGAVREFIEYIIELNEK